MKRKPPPNVALQRERFRQQMSKTALANKAGIARKTVVAIESRQSRVRFDTASRIAAALDREITDVFEEDEVIG